MVKLEVISSNSTKSGHASISLDRSCRPQEEYSSEVKG